MPSRRDPPFTNFLPEPMVRFRSDNACAQEAAITDQEEADAAIMQQRAMANVFGERNEGTIAIEQGADMEPPATATQDQ